MKYDDKLIEDAALALLATFGLRDGNAWKGFDFQVMNHLHEQGSSPEQHNRSGRRTKAWSVVGRLRIGCLVSEVRRSLGPIRTNDSTTHRLACPNYPCSGQRR